MGVAADDAKARMKADRWAARLLVVLGALGGGFFGLLCAPKIQRNLRQLGVDPYALGPGMVIVAIAICVGALLAWRAARRRGAGS